MLDPKLLRTDIENTAAELAKRGYTSRHRRINGVRRAT